MLEDFAKLIAWIIPVIVLAAIFLPQTIRILREYERGVIFCLGKLLGTNRAWVNLSHSDRRSHGKDGSARCDHRRRAPGSHDPGQRADDR